MDASVKSHLDSFLESEAGINYVHNNDVAQADKLMTEIFEPLRSTALYQNSTPDDQVRLATMVAKTYNQSERWGGRILDNVEAGNYASADAVKDAVGGLMRGDNDYMQTGRDAALKGAETLISLRNSDQRNPLHQVWQDVLANPLVNPNQTGLDADRPNLSSEYTATKNLFLRKENAPALVEALDQGGAYGYNITNSRGQSRPQSTSLYASGNDFVVMDGNGIGKAYVGGTWSDVDRANLTRVNNRDGTVDININRDGTTERLLHVDPNAPVLRPVQQPAEPAQPAPIAPTNQQDWGPFAPNQAPAIAPVMAPRDFGGSQGVDDNERQRAIEDDRDHRNDIPLPAPGAELPSWEEVQARENPQAFTTGDPDLDKLAAALFANDEAAISRVSAQIEQSPQVQSFEQWGRDLVAAQQREQLQQQEMARQQGPVMRM